MNKGFCEKCNDLVEYKIKEIDDKFEIRGKEYKYKRLIGYCKKCGEEISSNSINDDNLNRMDIIYRNEEKIIQKEEINKILSKYKIGKKPLSKLLGWGEVTLIRYLNGDVPSKVYSDLLYRILNDEKYMEVLVEQNKSLITENAYNNIKNAISQLKEPTFQFSIENELEIISEYIIAVGKEITPLALQKILYYAQGFYKAFFGKFLFKDDCQAWVHGPVYVKIYEKYKEFKSANILIDIDYDIEDTIVDEKREILDVIIKYFGYYNGKALEKMSHYETPWINARKGLLPSENSNNIIKKEDMEEYFEKVKNKYDMLNILDIKKYSEDHFKRVIEV
ncbi:MAG: DUF4065 domain-containing protein [Clostridia bacterium]|nr:DUF4065 domain-containing protein [Clostridia bacterium]